MPMIEGVIEPHGASAVSDDGKRWSLSFTLQPWREQARAWRRDRLYVAVPYPTLAATTRAVSRYPGGTIVALSIGKISPTSEYALARAVGRRPIKKIAGDATAHAVVERRKEGRVIDDPLLGRLTLEREFGWFSGKMKLAGSRCRVMIQSRDPDHENAVKKEIARGRALVERIAGDMAGIRARVAAEMLELYNRNWREHRARLSNQAFLLRLRLSSIQVAPKRITLHFDAGNLFWGHVIEVRIGTRGAISEICLAG
jgi:hypothetical protein